MNEYLLQVSAAGRAAARRNDWSTVAACAVEIRKHDDSSPEGYFLAGLVEKALQRHERAEELFRKVLDLEAERYDAAIELASLYSAERRNGAAAALLGEYEGRLSNSPHYLSLAGNVFSQVGMPEKAWPLYKKANELQPSVDAFLEKRATSGVFLG